MTTCVAMATVEGNVAVDLGARPVTTPHPLASPARNTVPHTARMRFVIAALPSPPGHGRELTTRQITSAGGRLICHRTAMTATDSSARSKRRAVAAVAQDARFTPENAPVMRCWTFLAVALLIAGCGSEPGRSLPALRAPPRSRHSAESNVLCCSHNGDASCRYPSDYGDDLHRQGSRALPDLGAKDHGDERS